MQVVVAVHDAAFQVADWIHRPPCLPRNRTGGLILENAHSAAHCKLRCTGRNLGGRRDGTVSLDVLLDPPSASGDARPTRHRVGSDPSREQSAKVRLRTYSAVVPV